MTHRIHRVSFFSAVLLAVVLALGGCDRNESHATLAEAPPPPSAPAPQAEMSGGAALDARKVAVQAPSAGGQAETPLQRFLAVRQDLAVEVPPEQLADAWSKVRDLCGALSCDLLSSSLLRETPRQPGSATLDMRVLPGDVDKLLGGLRGVSDVVSHTTTSEDKTSEVIDVEARIKNRTEFRDSLRLMLRDTATKRTMADLLEIQRTLSDTQAELDATATQRKVLAQQTDKQRIQIQFTPKRNLTSSGESYSPMRRALRNAGAVLAESVGALITFIAAVLPWLVLAVLPCLWLVRVLWRRRRPRV